MWCSGSTLVSEASSGGSIPLILGAFRWKRRMMEQIKSFETRDDAKPIQNKSNKTSEELLNLVEARKSPLQLQREGRSERMNQAWNDYCEGKISYHRYKEIEKLVKTY